MASFFHCLYFVLSSEIYSFSWPVFPTWLVVPNFVRKIFTRWMFVIIRFGKKSSLLLWAWIMSLRDRGRLARDGGSPLCWRQRLCGGHTPQLVSWSPTNWLYLSLVISYWQMIGNNWQPLHSVVSAWNPRQDRIGSLCVFNRRDYHSGHVRQESTEVQ